MLSQRTKDWLIDWRVELNFKKNKSKDLAVSTVRKLCKDIWMTIRVALLNISTGIFMTKTSCWRIDGRSFSEWLAPQNKLKSWKSLDGTLKNMKSQNQRIWNSILNRAPCVCAKERWRCCTLLSLRANSCTWTRQWSLLTSSEVEWFSVGVVGLIWLQSTIPFKTGWRDPKYCLSFAYLTLSSVNHCIIIIYHYTTSFWQTRIQNLKDQPIQHEN